MKHMPRFIISLDFGISLSSVSEMHSFVGKLISLYWCLFRGYLENPERETAREGTGA